MKTGRSGCRATERVDIGELSVARLRVGDLEVTGSARLPEQPSQSRPV